MSKLGIIVPHYKEPIDVVYRAISSIKSQVNCNFDNIEIYIVTDRGGVKLKERQFKKFGLNIKCMTTDYHAGPGYARQYVLDRIDVEYVMFIDSDDVFYSNFVLQYFMDNVDKDLDYLFTSYLEEYAPNKFLLKDDSTSIGCLHGKMYSLKFLKKFDIRFPYIYESEDFSFNMKVSAHATRCLFNDEAVTYVYKYTPGSITKSQKAFANYPANIKNFRMSMNGFLTFFEEIASHETKYDPSIIEPFIKTLRNTLQQISSIPNLGGPEKDSLYQAESLINTAENNYKKYFKENE